MSYPIFEYTLAKLLTDTEFLNLFLGSSERALNGLDLTQAEKDALVKMDHRELVLASTSFQKKKMPCKTREKLHFFPAINKATARFAIYLKHLVRRLN